MLVLLPVTVTQTNKENVIARRWTKASNCLGQYSLVDIVVSGILIFPIRIVHIDGYMASYMPGY